MLALFYCYYQLSFFPIVHILYMYCRIGMLKFGVGDVPRVFFQI